MKSLSVATGVVALLFLSGCEQPQQAAPGKASAAARFEAAKSIRDVAKKDRVLAEVANDASIEGDGDVVKKCIQFINTVAIKNEAAFTSAVNLARNNKGEDAKAVADMISDTARRDEALAKIATGG